MSFEIEVKHVEQPKLCDACFRDLLDRKSDTDAQHCVYCQHTGAQANVTVKDGQIVLWTITGPITPEQAVELASRMHSDDPVMASSPAVN